jgi:hypothetical protein
MDGEKSANETIIAESRDHSDDDPESEYDKRKKKKVLGGVFLVNDADVSFNKLKNATCRRFS